MLLSTVARHGELAGAVLVAALACAAVSRRRGSLGASLGFTVTEAVLIAGGVIGSGGVSSPLLLYAVALCLAAGMEYGTSGSFKAIALLVLSLSASRVLGPHSRMNVGAYLLGSVQWCVIGAATALLGALSRRMFHLAGRPQDASYLEAHRLLRNLRSVARALPGTLEPVVQAESVLDLLSKDVHFERAGVFVNLSSGGLSPLVLRGVSSNEWDLTMKVPLVAEAWLSQNVQVSTKPLARRAGIRAPRSTMAMVIPLEVGLRTFGIVALERYGTEPWDQQQIVAAARVAAAASLPLETATLFDEVRELAVAEERHRLAREIHDGIAQELAQLGYSLDEAVAQVQHVPALRDAVSGVRAEVSRIVGELRHSLFDLRSDIDPQGGLVAALATYVRVAAAQSGLVVNLSIDQATARLPVDVEAELLRIAQEAMANVRKHAGARTVWVSCHVSPPHARLSVEDDGVGPAGLRGAGGHGLEIMKERAARVKGRLEVGVGAKGGTIVRVTIGLPPEREEIGALEHSAR